MTQKREFKTLQIKNGAMDDNILKGDASGIGNLDSYDDVIFPGFFADALPSFLSNGFIADNHDWTKQLATPRVAEERGSALYTEAEFHSTQAAQDARTTAMERMERGKSVGLSIGFLTAPDGYKIFKCGADLLSFAKSSGYDMSLFDQKGILACLTRCRALLKCQELFEYSLATVPANRSAVASDVKARLLVDLKSQYLGDYIEGSMTMAALFRLSDALFYNVIYDCVYGDFDWDDDADDWTITRMPVEECLPLLRAAFDEFRDIALKVFEAIMSGAEGAEPAAEAAKSLKTLWSDPSSFDPAAHVSGRFETQLSTALAAVRGCIERGSAIHAKRSSETRGRSLSPERHAQFTQLQDGLATLIALSAPHDLSQRTLAIKMSLIRTKSYLDSQSAGA